MSASLASALAADKFRLGLSVVPMHSSGLEPATTHSPALTAGRVVVEAGGGVTVYPARRPVAGGVV